MVSISDLHGLRIGIRTHVGDAATDGEDARPGRGTACRSTQEILTLAKRTRTRLCQKQLLNKVVDSSTISWTGENGEGFYQMIRESTSHTSRTPLALALTRLRTWDGLDWR
jgi:hypothetical protein